MAANGTGLGDPEDLLRDLEVPDADALEQHRPLTDDPDQSDPETVAGRDQAARLTELPLEVSEADLVEQSVEVPFDDDEHG